MDGNFLGVLEDLRDADVLRVEFPTGIMICAGKGIFWSELHSPPGRMQAIADRIKELNSARVSAMPVTTITLSELEVRWIIDLINSHKEHPLELLSLQAKLRRLRGK